MAEPVEIRIPDIGDFDTVDVVEVLVSPGDQVAAEQSLIVLESDKASMEVPADRGGKVLEVLAKVGDSVSEGSVIIVMEPGADAAAGALAEDKPPAADPRVEEQPVAPPQAAPPPVAEPKKEEPPAQPAAPAPPSDSGPRPHAGPAVRRLARELGVDLAQVSASGLKGRILADDVRAYVKQTLSGDRSTGAGIPPVPEQDHARFGPIEVVKLSRVNKVAARNLHRSWLNVPHVTHFDEADITDLDEFRRQQSKVVEPEGFKLTLLSFVLVAAASTLKRFPRFNSSLLASGEELALKQYVHIGVAVDTEDGLVVPVIRDVDQKGVVALGRELADVSTRAREGRLGAADWQGASFTISSLGGIGGTGFTPIVNAPEVAILGVSRSSIKPVFQDGAFVPRLMLPISLSYDHRVIDGAAAARFTKELAASLSDLRRALL